MSHYNTISQMNASLLLLEKIFMQNAIYANMTQKGWYPTQQVEQQKISAVKQKFSGQ